MRPFRTLATAVFAFLALAAPALAQGTPDPEEVARRGIAAIDARSERASQALTRGAAAIVARIDELQAAGDQEAAQRLARVSIDRLNQRAGGAVEDVRRMARRTVAILNRLDASDELKQSVRDAAEAGATSVNESRQAAVASIREAVQP